MGSIHSRITVNVSPFGTMVIMSSLYDYDIWMQQTRQVFKELDVWQYADPDLGAESTESSTDDETINLPSTRSTATLQPTRPNKPEKGNVTDTTYREAISLYTDLCKIFKMKQAKLKKATAYLRSTLVRDIWREVYQDTGPPQPAH
nr:hypothetical protein CFP56_73749 [Quercus suber]